MDHCVSCRHDLGDRDRFCAVCGRRVGGPGDLTRTCSLLATGILAIWTGLLTVDYVSQWALSSMALLYYPFLVLAATGCAGPALRRSGARWGAANVLTLVLLLLAAGLSLTDYSFYITPGVALVAAVLHVAGIVAANRRPGVTPVTDGPVSATTARS